MEGMAGHTPWFPTTMMVTLHMSKANQTNSRGSFFQRGRIVLPVRSVSAMNSSEASTAPSGKDLDDVLPVASFLALSVIVMLVLDIIKEKYELMFDLCLVREEMETNGYHFCFLR